MTLGPKPSTLPPETFNRDKQLPYETLISSADQKRALWYSLCGCRAHACGAWGLPGVFIDVLSACREAGFSGVQVFDGTFFGETYGRETNVGFNMMTALC